MERMARERIRHEMAFRHVTVAAVDHVTPTMVRVTLRGDELAGFAADGPSDHVKVYFPDPATGVLTAPTWDADGVHRPTDGIVISRDYTPRAFRPEGSIAAGSPAELDLDFVLHGGDGGRAGGPASAWAAGAAVGDELVVGGPRGSLLAPTEVGHALLIADETGLPAFSRWLELLPASARITAVLLADDDATEDYLDEAQRARASVEWLFRFDGPGQLEESVHSIDTDAIDYVWAAGEAGELTPVRRMLKHERGIGPDRMQLQGYWRRGVTNLDHHAPLDPSDPD